MTEKQKIEHLTLPVEGMTCASCVARVEKSISSIEGIKNVAVNFATEKASFEIDRSITDLQQIKKVVEDAGYKIDLNGADKRQNKQATSGNEKDSKSEYEHNLKRDFIFALILTIPIMFLNMGTMFENFHSFLNLTQGELNKILLILATPVVFISGKRFFSIFWQNLKHFSADMNSLVAIGTGAAYLFSVANTLFPNHFSNSSLSHHVYFDTTVVIITLILLGRWLESRAKSKTGSVIKKLIALKPQKVSVLRNGNEIEINIDELELGDFVIVKPGGKIPADGILRKGNSSVDESMLTGESISVEKSVGSKIIGGSMNKTGTFEFEVTALGENSVLGQIIKMVEQAQGSKAPIQQLADKVASVFVPVIILIATITFFVWFFFATNLGINTALINFIAVLIIACPCALGLATPTALIVGIGKGAQNGILIKNAESLERFHKVDVIIFDKTGTLTSGKPKVTSVEAFGIDNHELIKFAASLETRSEHPIAHSIVEYSKEQNIDLAEVEEFESLTGFGLKGKINGKEILIGNKSLINKFNVEVNDQFENAESLLNNENAAVLVSINNKLSGLIIIQDTVKDEAFDAIKKLKSMKIKTVMLTGDNKTTAELIAKNSGIDEFEYELLPEDKINVVKKYQSQNKTVAMVGDGINDAPALAQSNLGIAIGTGTDVAIETGDIVLVKGDLNGVVKSFELSKQTIRIIKQNLFWAFIYNSIGVPLAAFGLLNPMFAALAMSFSSVSVVSNSLRLKKRNL